MRRNRGRKAREKAEKYKPKRKPKRGVPDGIKVSNEVQKAFDNLKKNVALSADDWYEAYSRAKAAGTKKNEDPQPVSQKRDREEDDLDSQKDAKKPSLNSTAKKDKTKKVSEPALSKKPNPPHFKTPKPPLYPTPPRPPLYPTPPRPPLYQTPPQLLLVQTSPLCLPITVPVKPVESKPSDTESNLYQIIKEKNLSAHEKLQLVEELVLTKGIAGEKAQTPDDNSFQRTSSESGKSNELYYRRGQDPESRFSSSSFQRRDDMEKATVPNSMNSMSSMQSSTGNRNELYNTNWTNERGPVSAYSNNNRQENRPGYGQRSFENMKDRIPNEGSNDLYERRERKPESRFANQNAWNRQERNPSDYRNASSASESSSSAMNWDRRDMSLTSANASACSTRNMDMNWSGPEQMRGVSSNDLYERREAFQQTKTVTNYSQNSDTRDYPNEFSGKPSSMNWERRGNRQSQNLPSSFEPMNDRNNMGTYQTGSAAVGNFKQGQNMQSGRNYRQNTYGPSGGFRNDAQNLNDQYGHQNRSTYNRTSTSGNQPNFSQKEFYPAGTSGNINSGGNRYAEVYQPLQQQPSYPFSW